MSMSEEYYPEALRALMDYFRRFPGVGRRGSERLVLSLLDWPPEETAALGTSLLELSSTIGRCPECGAWAEAGKLCRICSDLRRERELLCVVESMAQMIAVDSSGKYRGRYLVLGGRLSPLDGETGEGLNLDILKSCDWILDMGPDGGEGGGRIVACGTPEDLALDPESVTGPFLKEILH